MSNLEFRDRVAVITGAASGMGAEIARQLAAEGCHVALVDVNEDRLQEVANDLRQHNVRVTTHLGDVSDPEMPEQLKDTVLAEHGKVNFLFNNAGVATGLSVLEIDMRDFDRIMDINFHGQVRMTKAFLPEMLKQDAGQIVNTSSLFGLIAPPGQSAYCASKFALRGFTESLRHELKGRNVQVTSVHPGGVDTNIARESKIEHGDKPDGYDEQIKEAQKFLSMPPAKAAGIILDGTRKRKGRVLVGNDAKIMSFLQRLFPASYMGVMRKLLPNRGRDLIAESYDRYDAEVRNSS